MFYDLNEIKAVPCKDIAESYGIQLKKIGNRLWGKLRSEEKTASFAIKIRSNRWNDFGTGEGGSNIDLVMYLNGVNKTEAINHIAENFGIDPERIERNKWRPLSDNQYKELGIEYPQRATMNFGYDLRKHTIEQLNRWNEKYAVPVKTLAEKYPDVYNKLIEKFALKQIEGLKKKYSEDIIHYSDPTYNEMSLIVEKRILINIEKSINNKADLLQRAVTIVKKNYDYLKVNLDADIQEFSKSIENAKSYAQNEQENVQAGDIIVDNKDTFWLITNAAENKYESFEIVLKKAEQASITDIQIELDGKVHDYNGAFVKGNIINTIGKTDIQRKLGRVETEVFNSVKEKISLFKSKDLVQERTNINEMNLYNSMESGQRLNIS